MSRYNQDRRGNPFVEADRQSVENKIYEGHKVFRVRSRILLHVEEISGEFDREKWEWNILYFSHPSFDDLDVNEFKGTKARNLIFDYYDGQRENGVVNYYEHTLTIPIVEKYDNNNVAQLPLQGESYKVRMLKNIKDVELKLVKNQCLFDYLCYKIVGKPGFEDYSRDKLYKELGKKTTLCIDDIEAWIKKGTKKGKYDKNISLYAWWENRRSAYKFKTNNPHNNTIVLNFMITDLHVLPVEHEQLFTANTLKNLKTLSYEAKEAEAEINWELDYHFNNFYYVDHETYDKNEDAILSGTFKPDVEALIFEKRIKVEGKDNIDIVTVGNKVMHKTKYKLSYVNLNRDIFKHPTREKHQNYVFCEDFKDRKDCCDTLFKKTKMINFKFNNQSWGEISRVLMDYYLDNNEKWQSCFRPELRDVIDDLCCKPLVQGVQKENMMDSLVTWDINKCYTMAIVEGLKDQYIPIYHLGDNPQVFDESKHVHRLSSKNPRNGKLKEFLYYIPTTVLKPYGLIIREGIYPHVLIQHLLDEKHIKNTDIKYTFPCLQFAQGDALVAFVEKVYQLLKHTKHWKMIINVAVGLFNTKYECKSDEVMISASPPFTIAYNTWHQEQNNKNLQVDITGDDNLDWIRTRSKKRKMKDNGVINQYVVASGLVRTLKMLKNKWIDGMKLVGLKTDAIYLNIPTTVNFDCEECEMFRFQCRKCRKAGKPKPKSIYDLAVEKDQVLEWYNLYDFGNVHPKFYDKVSEEIDNLWDQVDDADAFDAMAEDIEIPTIKETLNLIKKYPYKIEQNKKPPKYDRERMDQLKSTIGYVIDEEKIIPSPLKDIDEKTFKLKLKDLEQDIDETVDFSEEKKIRLKNIAKKLFKVLVYGTAGSGKSTLGVDILRVLLKIAKLFDQHVIVTSYQRSCVNNFIKKVIQINKKTKKEKIGSWHKKIIEETNTNWNWDNFYGNVLNDEYGTISRRSKCKRDASKIFAIIIDEFFQMPERCLIDMCSLLDDNHDIILVPIGDYNQMPGIATPKYNWLKSYILNNFVDYKLYKNYIIQSGRFSEEVLYLLRLLEKGDYEHDRKFIKYITKKNKDGSFVFEDNDVKKYKWHICNYRKKRFPRGVIQLNRKLCPKIEKGSFVICDKKYDTYEFDRKGKQIIIKYTDRHGLECEKKPKVPILVGEKYKVLAVKDQGIKKQCKLEVDDYGKKKYGWFPMKYKRKDGSIQVILSPANASTAFREQGREITQPYLIHDAHEMTRQTLIVAISRGKCKKGCLFKFSNLGELVDRYGFGCAYKDQFKVQKVPSCYDGYKPNDINKPRKNEYQKNLLVEITDVNDVKYIGEHTWNENKTLKENLDDRMKGHLNDKVPDEKKSPVLEMNEPEISPFYGKIKDRVPYFIYGKYKDILKVEKKHIQQILTAGYTVYNKAGIARQPKINEEKIQELDVQQEEIQNAIKKFKIETVYDKKSKKNPSGKRYVIYGKTVAEALGYKGDRIRSADYDEIVDMKKKAIAKLCMITTRKVKEVEEKMKEEKKMEKEKKVKEARDYIISILEKDTHEKQMKSI